jgi:hypothetical protein
MGRAARAKLRRRDFIIDGYGRLLAAALNVNKSQPMAAVQFLRLLHAIVVARSTTTGMPSRALAESQTMKFDHVFWANAHT